MERPTDVHTEADFFVFFAGFLVPGRNASHVAAVLVLSKQAFFFIEIGRRSTAPTSTERHHYHYHPRALFCRCCSLPGFMEGVRARKITKLQPAVRCQGRCCSGSNQTPRWSIHCIVRHNFWFSPASC